LMGQNVGQKTESAELMVGFSSKLTRKN